MGELADEVLAGWRCEQCGGLVGDDEEPGHPRSCPACLADTAPARPKRRKRRRFTAEPA